MILQMAEAKKKRKIRKLFVMGCLSERYREELKQEMIDMLHIQLRDNQKAGWVDENLKNVLKKNPNEEPVRAQYAFYEYLKEKNDRNRL